MLMDMTVKEFLTELASNSPAPGGGSVSAMAGSLSAALVSMVANLTTDNNDSGQNQDVDAALKRAADLMAVLEEAVDADTEAFNKVMDAYRLPKQTEEEKKKRSQAIQQALQGAALHPMKVARQCLDVLRLCSWAAAEGNPNALSDAGVAALLALYDGINAAKVIDLAGALTFEALKGTIKAFDSRLHSVKKHTEQQGTARNMLRILQDSEIAQKSKEERIQDCVSLRGIPQIHGAAKRVLKDAFINLTNEMNSCSDNPIIYPQDGDGTALMGVNPEGSYVGIYCDSICIAMGVLANLSERRIDRLTNSYFSGLPPFLANNPGLNNGYMIAQYTAAGLVGDIKVLSHPSSVDSITTSANQEDFVSMAYSASNTAYQVAKKLQYILAIELMVAVQGLDLLKPLQPSSASQAVYNLIREKVPTLEEDRYFYPDIEYIFQLIRSGTIIDTLEEVVGEMEF
jgi:formiminotetrahydrofolate cyclodeaminase